jgi:hypothetical protein
MNNEWDVNFDEVEAIESNLIPNGKYRMALEKVSQAKVKNGDNVGKPMLNCQFTITDDKQRGRKVFMNFAPHVYYQVGLIKGLATATKTPVQNGSFYSTVLSLIDKEFMATIGVAKNNDPSHSDQNTITAFKALPTNQSQSAPAAYQPPQQAYAPVQPQPPIRTGETAIAENGKPIFRATDGQWYYSQ